MQPNKGSLSEIWEGIKQAVTKAAQALSAWWQAITNAINNDWRAIVFYCQIRKHRAWAAKFRRELDADIERDQALRWQELETKHKPPDPGLRHCHCYYGPAPDDTEADPK